MASITPGNWINALRGAAESRANERNERQYIAEVVAGGRDYRVIDASQRNQKLPVQEIVEISKAKLQELGVALEGLGEGDRTERDNILSQARQISVYTEELIRGKEEKGWLRTAAHIFTSFLKALGLESTWLDNFVDTATEEASLRANFNAVKPQALRDLEAQKAEIIQAGLAQIPKLVRDSNSTESRSRRSEFVLGEVSANLQEPEKMRFAQDIRRDISFMREDRSINDRAPLPSPPIEGQEQEERITQGTAALEELVTSQDDPKWAIILKSVASQATFNALWGGLKAKFAEDNTDTWGERRLESKLGLEESTPKPPIHLKIIRDWSGRIKKVKVVVKDSLSIVACRAGNGEKIETIKPKAFVGTFEYTISLNTQGEPVIDASSRITRS